MSLTVCYITAREEPRFDWFIGSLRPQVLPSDHIKLVVVDTRADEFGRRDAVKQLVNGGPFRGLWHVEPMANVWQGKSRITKCDWWAIATAKNTGLCLAGTDWVAFCDDRSVLGPRWMESVRTAMVNKYAVAGAYQKVHNLESDGRKHVFKEVPEGIDTYRKGHPERAMKCPGHYMFGCTMAVPVEWALTVNGFDETCNMVGIEDTMFGAMLANNNYPICYDMRMFLLEDRTPDKLGTLPKRKDKGVSPSDKSHALLYKLVRQKRAIHDRDIRAIRATVLNGGSWPLQTDPVTDWYDAEPLSQMEP